MKPEWGQFFMTQWGQFRMTFDNFVFTACDEAAGEVCPVWPGQPMTAHWGIEDPAKVGGTDIQKEAAFHILSCPFQAMSRTV